MNDAVYFNFPVTMLQGAFDNISHVMNDIMDYAGYVHALSLEYGDKSKKMQAAGKFFGITWGNEFNSYANGKALYERHNGSLPKVGINKDIAFDFYKNRKTEYEIAVLLAYLALKSIVGMKPYIKTSNNFLIARMGGFISTRDVPKKLPMTLKRYTTRRFLDKIKFDLRNNWKVNFYSRYVRGFYVSFDQKFTLDQLVLEAEKRRKSNIEQQNRKDTEAARIKALQSLGIIN